MSGRLPTWNLPAGTDPSFQEGDKLKREAIDHTKLKRLCRRLKIPVYVAVGILETLWHVTAKQTPRGDIGKLSDEEIAIGLDYPETDLPGLLAALIDCGWIDPDPTFRLVIHDWPEHADDAVHMRLARHRQTFAVGVTPKTTRLPKWEREEADNFFGVVRTDSGNVRTKHNSVHTPDSLRVTTSAPPEPEPRQSPAPPEPRHVVEPSNTPPFEAASQICASSDARVIEFPPSIPKNGTGHHPEWFDQWWAIYWRKVARKDAEKAFRHHVKSPDRFSTVMESTRAQTPAMMARDPDHRPYGASWLNAERWDDEPSIPAKAQPPRRETAMDRTKALWAERIAKGQSPL